MDGRSKIKFVIDLKKTNIRLISVDIGNNWCIIIFMVETFLTTAPREQGLEMKMRKVAIINGYDLKDLIKKFGGSFRGSDKAWIISQEGFEKLLKFNSASAGMATFRAFSKIIAYSEI